jgi:5,10-methylenetetrahydromethanopterin reductase
MSDRLVFHIGFPSPSIAEVSMAEWPELARTCELAGFGCLWHSNERFYREMWIRMTTSIMVTEQIGIGGAVAEPFAVHPALTAQALATAAELSGGRATIAMGAGGSGFPMMGITRSRPAVALREALTVIRGLLDGEVVTLDGEFITARKARLHFSPPEPVPLWVATRGDQTLQVGGELADGIMIATRADAQDVMEALKTVAKGAARAGRTIDDLRVMARVDTCVHEDPEVALEGSRSMVAKLLWASYPDRLFVERVGLRVPDEIEEVMATRDYDALHEVADKIPESFVEKFCWAGSPDDVARRVADVMKENHIREVGFWVLRAGEQSLFDAVEMVSSDVMPRIREHVAGPPRG